MFFLKKLLKKSPKVFERQKPPPVWDNDGLPPLSLSWEQAKKLPRSGRVLHNCPVCDEVVDIIKDDWQWIGESGQYMVYIYCCPNGHGYNVWIA